MLKMTLRASGSEHTLSIYTGDKPAQRYDLSHMNRNQLDGVRELVVNAWAAERGLPEPYAK